MTDDEIIALRALADASRHDDEIEMVRATCAEMEFIAACREAMPLLCDEVVRLRAALAALVTE